MSGETVRVHHPTLPDLCITIAKDEVERDPSKWKIWEDVPAKEPETEHPDLFTRKKRAVRVD